MAFPTDPALVIDAILLLVALEAAALLVLWGWWRTGIAPSRALPMLGAGACLLLAMRAILAGQPWRVSALWLGLSFIAHLADVAGRWRRRPDAGPKTPPE
jgi:hypothetical protein